MNISLINLFQNLPKTSIFSTYCFRNRMGPRVKLKSYIRLNFIALNLISDVQCT